MWEGQNTNEDCRPVTCKHGMAKQYREERKKNRDDEGGREEGGIRDELCSSCLIIVWRTRQDALRNKFR